MAIDPEQVEQAQQELAKVRDSWLARRGVIAVEVARLRTEGVPTDEVGIRVTVERKLPEDRVTQGEVFPRRQGPVTVHVTEGQPSRPE